MAIHPRTTLVKGPEPWLGASKKLGGHVRTHLSGLKKLRMGRKQGANSHVMATVASKSTKRERAAPYFVPATCEARICFLLTCVCFFSTIDTMYHQIGTRRVYT
eukprot:scaffold1008_cov106-Skeletonema_dohrnii-CCMP3373.AAC.4